MSNQPLRSHSSALHRSSSQQRHHQLIPPHPSIYPFSSTTLPHLHLPRDASHDIRASRVPGRPGQPIKNAGACMRLISAGSSHSQPPICSYWHEPCIGHELMSRPPGSRPSPPPPPCPRRPCSPRRLLPPDLLRGTDTCTDCRPFSRRPAPTPRTRVCTRLRTPGRTRDRSRPLTTLRSDVDTRVSRDRRRVGGYMGGLRDEALVGETEGGMVCSLAESIRGLERSMRRSGRGWRGILGQSRRVVVQD